MSRNFGDCVALSAPVLRLGSKRAPYESRGPVLITRPGGPGFYRARGGGELHLRRHIVSEPCGQLVGWAEAAFYFRPSKYIIFKAKYDKTPGSEAI